MTLTHRTSIARHAEHAFPEECCGVLVGREVDGAKEVQFVRSARNVAAADRDTRYEIDPEELLASERFARDRGLDVVGYYHSHPGATARPSATDRARGLPWASYVIVSVREGRAAELTSWTCRVAGGVFDEEPLDVRAGE